MSFLTVDDNAAYWNNIGVVNAIKGNLGKAIPNFKTAINQKSGKPEPYYNLGVAYLKRNVPRKAFKYFMLVLKKDPRFAEAWHGVALALDKLNRREKILHAIQMALEINPKYFESCGKDISDTPFIIVTTENMKRQLCLPFVRF